MYTNKDGSSDDLTHLKPVWVNGVVGAWQEPLLWTDSDENDLLDQVILAVIPPRSNQEPIAPMHLETASVQIMWKGMM